MAKGHPANLSDDQTDEMERLYLSGMTLREIGNSFDLSPPKIYNVLKSRGLTLRVSGTRRGYKHTNEFCEKISNAKKGFKHSEVAKLKMSESSRCHYNGLNGYGHTKKHSRGYIQCYAPEHPYSRSDGYVMLHRVLMEIRIGRYLTEDEVVHHINSKRDDNSYENLVLMSRHDHMSMHTKKRLCKGGDLYELYHNHR